jgi:dTDP-4-dehydrorhamnose reductase
VFPVKKKLLIPGVSGLFGLNLAMMHHRTYDIIGTVHSHSLKTNLFKTKVVDLSVKDSGAKLVEETQPDMIINCAAIANLETSENQPELALRMNAELSAELASAAKQMGIPYVHLSTDAVFDGKKGNYSEEDAINPINAYAKTKAKGEQFVQAANPNAILARINFYGWSLSGKRSLSEFHYNNLTVRKSYSGFHDLYYSPMMVSDLVDTVLEMVENDLHGLYHVSVAEQLSKYQFGVLLAKKFGLDANLIQSKSWKEFGFKAERSENLTMDVTKLQKALGHALPTIDDGLTRLKKQLEDGYRQRMMALGE